MSLTPETAPPSILIQAFANLINPFLLDCDDVSALWQMISILPDDAAAISQQLIRWCQEREILEALEGELSNRGPSPFIPAPKPEDYKTLLKNKLRENFPEPPQNPSGSKK